MSDNSPYTIAIVGGIGAGKSIVSRILSTMGYAVYDSDSRAKHLMDKSVDIRKKLCETFGPQIMNNGYIDRKRLSEIVFSDPAQLSALNGIVHGEVIADFIRWRENSCKKPVFIETAILYESGLDKFMDEVWEVTAPKPLRIARVMRRNNMSREDVCRRISSQAFIPETPHPYTHVIVNDDIEPVLPQVLRLLAATVGEKVGL